MNEYMKVTRKNVKKKATTGIIVNGKRQGVERGGR